MISAAREDAKLLKKFCVKGRAADEHTNAKKPSRSGLESLDHTLRSSENVEVGLFFAFKHVEEVKSTYLLNAAHPAE